MDDVISLPHPLNQVDSQQFKINNADFAGICKHCGGFSRRHGWIKNENDSHVVCPGDRIIVEDSGYKYPCKLSFLDKYYKRIGL